MDLLKQQDIQSKMCKDETSLTSENAIALIDWLIN